ncbi:hypothetical protein CFC21_050739 [Triticum aestivum]|uniref:PGG domain-containing protein n=4 Tax=Triticinae TaxID=1648030 RepID=A0A453GXP8_AEGTS|nr:hypothetical protein CFC21_050739 [Triticum aestivum]
MAAVAADPPAHAQQHQRNEEEAGIVTVSMPPDDPAPAPDPPLLLQIPTAAASSLPKGVVHVLVVHSTGAPTAGLQAVLVPAASCNGNAPVPDPIPPARDWELRGWLMVLATLIASITYASGLSPPGGFQVKEVRTLGTASTKNQQQQFMPVLLEVNSFRYMMFYYANTLAFALSLSIIMLLASQDVRKLAKTKALKILVALDVLALWVAYICGSSFNGITQMVSLAIVFVLLLALTIRGKYFWDEV